MWWLTKKKKILKKWKNERLTSVKVTRDANHVDRAHMDMIELWTWI